MFTVLFGLLFAITAIVGPPTYPEPKQHILYDSVCFFKSSDSILFLFDFKFKYKNFFAIFQKFSVKILFI